MRDIIYVIIIIIVSIVYIAYVKRYEGFTVYEIDYGTGIGPWWAQGAGLNRGFHRCTCYGSGDCRCLNDNTYFNTSVYPQYYFN